MAVVYAALSALTWGVSDFVGGATSRRTRALLVAFASQAVGLVVAVAAAPLLDGSMSSGALVWGAVAGLGAAGGLLTFFHGLATGPAATVAPVAACVGAGLPVIVGIVEGDRPGATAAAGIALALPSLWLVTRGTPDNTASTSRVSAGVAGVLAGCGFATFFVFLDATPDGAGLWPLVPARFSSVIVLGSLMLAASRPDPVPAGDRRSVIAGVVFVGAGNIVANALFLAATREGLLSLVVVVSSMYPAITVVLARVYGETIRPAQVLGGVGALVAVCLIAV